MTVGDLKGGANHIIISGGDARTGNFIHYEWPAGGTGASAGTDGSNAVRSYNEGDFNSIQSVETVESQFPLRIERCEIREGACGDGEFRGGFGLRRDVRILSKRAALSVLSEKNVIPPYGVEGGSNGAANSFTVIRDGAVIQPSDVPGKVSGFALRSGDIVREETAGGGGYGDPLCRSPEKVLAEVTEGYLTAEQAALRYGVVLRDGKVDAAGTAARRSELAEARVTVSLEAANEELSDGPRRQFVVPQEIADTLGVGEGELVELVTGRGAPLRAWARFGGSGETVVVSPSSLAILGVRPGDRVGLRAARTRPELCA
ncbi:MAG: hydantoinase B/oxoprolinase family protein, partial [Rhodospirillaceae bacterium]